jgi:hypothetical protein
LSAEMLRQTQTNEELMSSLAAAKNSNKSLMEQVKKQSEELALLTRQRVGDEERMEDFKRRSRLDDDLREKDVQRRIAAVQEGADVRVEKARQAFADKMRRLQVYLDKVQKDFGRLRLDHADQRRASGILAENAKQLFQQTEWTLCQRLEAFAKQQLEFRASSSDATRDLELRIVTEREMRINEVSSWSHRHALLQAERDDLQSRLARDVGQLGSQLQAEQRGREEDRHRWCEEQAELCRQREELSQRCKGFEVSVDQLRGGLSRGEIAHVALEQQLRESDKRTEETRLQLRETEDALTSTVAGNETLRKELEDQRRRLSDANDSALTSCKEAYERRLLQAAEDGKMSLARVNENVLHANERALLAEERLRASETELERSRMQGERAGEETGALRIDLGQAKAEVQEVCHVQRRLEGELADSRHQLAEERVRLQGVIERLEHQKAALQGEAQLMQERLLELTQSAADRDAQSTKITGALEAGIRDRDGRLEERELKLVEARSLSVESAADANAQKSRASELQVQLETTVREAAEERRRLEEERQRLEDGLTAQAKAAKDSQDQYERWRESHSTTLRQVQEESVARASSLEHDREECRSEMVSTKERLAEALTRLEATEQDLARLRYLLNESQTGAERIKKEKELEEREATSSRQHMQEELRRVTSALETATRNEVSLTQQLEDSSNRNQQDRTRTDREIVDIKRSSEVQLSERDQRIEWLKAEYEKRIQALESHHASEVDREKARVDAALHQNEQLRLFFTEQKKNSTAGMSSLQSQLESHINRLQQHTAELRGDLNRSAPATLPNVGPGSPRAMSSFHFPSMATAPLPNSGSLGQLGGGLWNKDSWTQPALSGLSGNTSGFIPGADFSADTLTTGAASAAWRDVSSGYLKSAGTTK